VAYIYIRGSTSSRPASSSARWPRRRAAGYLRTQRARLGLRPRHLAPSRCRSVHLREETGLLESLEGSAASAHQAAFPAVSAPSASRPIINNVETLMNVPYIVERAGVVPGRSARTRRTPRPRSSASRALPHAAELRAAARLHDAARLVMGPGGGPLPAGSSRRSSPAARRAGADRGRAGRRRSITTRCRGGHAARLGGVIVMDDTTCIVRACENLMHFYAHESCGQGARRARGDALDQRITGGDARGARPPPTPSRSCSTIADNMASRPSARWPRRRAGRSRRSSRSTVTSSSTTVATGTCDVAAAGVH